MAILIYYKSGNSKAREEENADMAEESSEIIFDEGESDYQIEYTETRKIFTHKAEPTVENLHKQSKRGKLNLQPDFQRQFVWDKEKASSLIESLLLDVPLPIIYLAEEQGGSQVVIDGQQRLSSIFSFIDGTFPDRKAFKLNGMKILRQLNQKAFSEIEERYQDKIESSPLSVIIVKNGIRP